MGRVEAVCISEKKGTQKVNIGKARLIDNFGIENDAHGGPWHRQVSLLEKEKIEEFRKKGILVGYGAFGENLVVEGIDFAKLPVGTKFKCGEVLLELTQIGKICHDRCHIYNTVGDCIMPREGVFTRVLKGGDIAVGDLLEIVEEKLDYKDIEESINKES